MEIKRDIIADQILFIVILCLSTSCNLNPNRGEPVLSSFYSEDSLHFDSKLWDLNLKKYSMSENDRHYMLADLVNNHLKIGMDSSEVKALLGEPERDFGFSYNLGLYRSGFDPTFLILDFNTQGKLKEFKVQTI